MAIEKITTKQIPQSAQSAQDNRVEKIKRRLMATPEKKVNAMSVLAQADGSMAEKIDEYAALKQQMSDLEGRMKVLKEFLTAEVVSTYGAGCRSNDNGCTVSEQSRDSLNRDKLLQYIPIDKLAECYDTSVFYVMKVGPTG